MQNKRSINEVIVLIFNRAWQYPNFHSVRIYHLICFLMIQHCMPMEFPASTNYIFTCKVDSFWFTWCTTLYPTHISIYLKMFQWFVLWMQKTKCLCILMMKYSQKPISYPNIFKIHAGFHSFMKILESMTYFNK